MADVVVNSDNTDAKELLGQGIRAYVLEDYNSAVTALSRASELLVAEHGDDLHDSLGDVYLYYGRALLELSREDAEPLGDAVKNKDESDDDDEEEVENTETEKGDDKEKTDAETNGVEEATEGTGDKKDEAEEKVVEANGTEKESEPSGSGDNLEEKQDNEEEPSDLQVAWEVLELAKKIFQKRGEEGKKHIAETLVVLGEVSLENENFESAVNDIKEGLSIQKELFPNDSRTVAETYYKLGIAYSTNTQIDLAVDSFQTSLQYLQNRIDNLEKEKERSEEANSEISEIKGLIPDIEEKIADMKSYKDETLNKILSAVTTSKPTTGGASSSSSGEVSSSKPVSDISHLVKRKRKLDEVVEEAEKEAEASAAKKPPS